MPSTSSASARSSGEPRAGDVPVVVAAGHLAHLLGQLDDRPGDQAVEQQQQRRAGQDDDRRRGDLDAPPACCWCLGRRRPDASRTHQDLVLQSRRSTARSASNRGGRRRVDQRLRRPPGRWSRTAAITGSATSARHASARCCTCRSAARMPSSPPAPSRSSISRDQLPARRRARRCTAARLSCRPLIAYPRMPVSWSTTRRDQALAGRAHRAGLVEERVDVLVAVRRGDRREHAERGEQHARP